MFRWFAMILVMALIAAGRASAFSVVLAAEHFPRSPMSAGSGGWRELQPMTPGGERRVRYGYDVRTACCCTYDVAMSQAFLRNSCRARPGDLVAFSALVPGAHDCELLRVEFTGKERDAETGLDYFGARYLSAAQGRFTSPDPPLLDQDPGDPQSWNLYAYVRNNPLKFVDLTGNDCIYTNNFSTDGTVSVERGSCSQKGGTFVDGTINVDSLSYDRKTNALGYSYANDAAGTGGAGTLGLRSAPSGDELRLGALPRAGQLAGPVADPRFIAGFYGASTLAGYALYAGGAFAGGELTALNIGGATATAETSSATGAVVGSGLRRQIAAHREKLAEYIKNPDAFDNEGLLKNVSPELRQRIIEGRVKHLQQEIKAFEKGLEKLLGGK